MSRVTKFLLILTVAAGFALSASVALAAISTTTNPANAPSGTHLANGTSTPACTVSGTTVNCNSYVLGGVGNTNATVSLTAHYSAIVDCRNHGGSVVESHTTSFSSTSTTTVTSTKNGQLSVPTRSVSSSG